jgi:hypothetical protein
MALSGLPQSDPATAARSALIEAFFEIGSKYGPHVTFRALPEAVLAARKRWPENERPVPIGVKHVGDKAPTDYRVTPLGIESAGDALAQALLAQMIDEGGPLQHKAVLLHAIIVQAINASFRATGEISPESYVFGLANGISQMLAVSHPDLMFDAFMKAMPLVFDDWRQAGLGAGINWSAPKGSA